MTQYLLSVWSVEGEPMPDAATASAMYAGVDAFNYQLKANGAWVFAGGLEPTQTATVIRTAGGETVMTDGPFAESKEQLGGFWVIEAPDLDAALELARQGSVACAGPVEVRPFQPEPSA